MTPPAPGERAAPHPVLVVADDLTGANATAAGLARAGLRSVTVTDADHPEVIAEFVSRFDAVVVSANNRHDSPGAAAEQVRRAVRAGWPASVVANRIDSTLRGNVGATTEALVEELEELSDEHVVALCVPAHPAAARQTVGGVQLLDGQRLEETELARDARSPIRHSEVVTLIGEQTGLPVREIALAVVTGPDGELRDALRAAVADGVRIVVADALTLGHVERVVHAAADVASSPAPSASAAEGRPLRWLHVDPGPATVVAAGLATTGAGRDHAPYLAVSGSATELTRSQLARLRSERTVHVLRPDLDADAVPDVDASAERLADALSRAAAGEVVLLASVLDAADLREGPARERIPRALARIARRALEEVPVDGLYATGGDVASACFSELAADGLDVTDEVVPLAVGGTLVGGPWSGLPVVTKGGLVGDVDTAVACLAFLERTAESERRHVPPARSRQR